MAQRRSDAAAVGDLESTSGSGWRPNPAEPFAAKLRSTPPALRAVRVVVRAIHIPAIALVIGAWWLGHPEAAKPLAWALAGGSGVALGGLFFFQSELWFLEVRGLAVCAKVVALATLPWLTPPVGLWVLLVACFVAGVASHMPGRFRHLRVDRWLRARAGRPR